VDKMTISKVFSTLLEFFLCRCYAIQSCILTFHSRSADTVTNLRNWRRSSI